MRTRRLPGCCVLVITVNFCLAAAALAAAEPRPLPSPQTVFDEKQTQIAKEYAAEFWKQIKAADQDTDPKKMLDKLMKQAGINRSGDVGQALLNEIEKLGYDDWVKKEARDLVRLKEKLDPDLPAGKALLPAAEAIVREETKLLRQSPIVTRQKTSSMFSFNAGVVMLNPYNVTKQPGGTYLLEPRGTTTDTYLELRYVDRWAITGDHSNFKDNGWCLGNWDQWTREHLFDFDFRAGFILRNTDKTPDQVRANTLMGAGDFQVELGAGFPIYRQSDKEGIHSHSVNLEVRGGVTTDRGFQSVHPSVSPGLGLHTSVKTAKGLALLSATVGYAWIDTPSFANAATLEVATSRGLPKFHMDASPNIAVDLHYPILASGIYFTAGGEAFIRASPAPWTMHIGLTLDAERMTKMFSNFFAPDDTAGGGAKK